MVFYTVKRRPISLQSCSAQKQKEASLGEVRSWLLSPDLSSPLLGSPALKPDADDKNENRLPNAIDSSSRTVRRRRTERVKSLRERRKLIRYTIRFTLRT